MTWINLSWFAEWLWQPKELFYWIFDNYETVFDMIKEFITNPIFSIFAIILLILILIDR